MANYDELKAIIEENIYPNGQREINAAKLLGVLLEMTDSLGEGYQFMGLATPETDATLPDERVFYIASAGDYPNFGLTVGSGVLAFLYNGETEWQKSEVEVGSEVLVNDEDLMYGDGGHLEFADRASGDGLGYKILRTGGGLTFAEQVTDENTIYEIRNDFDLNDSESENHIALPSGCVLRFNGGSITNGALTGTVAIENMPAHFFENVNCNRLNITTFPHLSLGDVSECFDNYVNGIVANRHEQNIVGSAYYYDITGHSVLYYMGPSGSLRARLCFYDEGMNFISNTEWINTYTFDVPSGAKYVTFILSFSPSDIPNIETKLKGLSFSFLVCPRIFISDEMRFGGAIPDSFSVKRNDISRTYITATDGIFKIFSTNDDYNSICIPYSVFKFYDYISVTANSQYATRVHILKEEPKISQSTVAYSDYYGKSALVTAGQRFDINIPSDARYIFVMNSTDGNNNTPDAIVLSKASYPTEINADASELSNRDMSLYSHKFLHWNIGNFSLGVYNHSTIDADNYAVKLAGFNTFLYTYAADSHIMFNEYNETFAIVNGDKKSTTSVLDGLMRKTYATFPRTTSTGYNKLACFWKEGLRCYMYDVFKSLKGVTNSNGACEYGTGYTLSAYNIGGAVLYVLGLHYPNAIREQADVVKALDAEILGIVSGLSNVVLAGDFNKPSASEFADYITAGFTILNPLDGNDSPINPTHPSNGATLDWVLYKLNGLSISDFRVYDTEAVDGNGELLSDHLPISFTVTRAEQAYVTKNKGNYRYNISTNQPEWFNGEDWFSFNANGETPTAISSGTDLNSIVAIGQYYCGSGTTAGTLTHKPKDFVNSGFQLWVRPIAGSGSGRVIQILKGNYTNSPVYTRRSETNKTFTQVWEKIDSYVVGTQDSSGTLNFLYGTSVNRNNLLVVGNIGVGHKYFDTDLNKPVFWNSTYWVDAIGNAVTYPITFTLSHVTASNTRQPNAGESYTTTLSAASGYSLPATIAVTMGGSTLSVGTDYTYNTTTGELVILGSGGTGGVTGAVIITASGVQ